jgi:peptide/nickel transport system substrate-binding protein
MHTRLRRPRAAALALTAALAVLLTACGSDTGGGTDPAAQDARPQSGGTLTIGLQSAPQSANPRAFLDTAAVYVNRQLFDSLVSQDPQTGEIQPWLAESWQVNEDATAFTFELRDDVTFSDGTALTAEVVRANFEDLQANATKINPSIAAVLTDFEGATADGPTTVTLRFARPNAPFLAELARVGLSIVAQATLDLPWDDRVDQVVGSGPFVLDTFAADEITLTRRDGYAWGPESDREAYLDEVVFRVVPESGVRTGSLQSGQLQVVSDVPAGDIQTLRDGGLQIITQPNPGLPWGLVPISARSPLDDPRVRRALSLAVDRTEVVQGALSAEFSPATSVLAVNTPGYRDLSAEVTTDTAEAERLLDEAGWTRDGDGVRTRDGEELSLEVAWFDNSSANQRVLELISAQLAGIGVDLRLLQQTGVQILEGLQDVAYDLFWTNGTKPDGDILRSSFSSAPPNYYQVNDDTLEDLLQGQLAEGDPARRAGLVGDAQERIVEQGWFVPVYEQTTVLAADPDVHDLALGAGAGLDQLTDVWLS